MIDVLQYIVSEQDSLQDGLKQNTRQSSVIDTVYAVQRKIAIDLDYLLPEVAELSQSAKLMAAKVDALGRTCLSKFAAFKDASPQARDGALVELQAMFNSYCRVIQHDLMPIMRAKMPTFVREELSEVFVDLSESFAGLAKYA